jgi:protein-S-isoprenylcysteine O-methyltransferase Ste14
MKTAFVALRALVYATGFITLWAWLSLATRNYDARLGVVLPEWSQEIGVIVMVVGAAIGLTCIAFFVVRGQGTAAPFDAPREFVTVGPYIYVRNPMYIGALTLAVGFGFYNGSVSMILFSLFFLLLAHLFVILVEEPGLGNRFGQSYLDYKKSVPRWIPKWR